MCPELPCCSHCWPTATQLSTSDHIVKYADDTTIVGHISDNESVYRQEVDELERWCKVNSLIINANKPKEARVRAVGCSLTPTADFYMDRGRDKASCISKRLRPPCTWTVAPLPWGRRLRSTNHKTEQQLLPGCCNCTDELCTTPSYCKTTNPELHGIAALMLLSKWRSNHTLYCSFHHNLRLFLFYLLYIRCFLFYICVYVVYV